MWLYRKLSKIYVCIGTIRSFRGKGLVFDKMFDKKVKVDRRGLIK